MTDTIEQAISSESLLGMESKQIAAQLGLTVLDIEAFRSLRLSDDVIEIVKEADEKLAAYIAKDKKNGPVRDLAETRTDAGVRINPYLLNVKTNWNCRDKEDLDNLYHMIGLAKSIAEVGVLNPITVATEGNRLFITDGHTRLGAVFIAEVHRDSDDALLLRLAFNVVSLTFVGDGGTAGQESCDSRET